MKSDNFKTIVFVDDDLRICEEIMEYLHNKGFKLIFYTNPNSCLKNLLNTQCDLLIIDYKLPEMDGITLMKAAKQKLPFLPVIIITGYSNTPLVVSAMREGAVDFLEKPIDTELLLKKIKTVLQNNTLDNLTSNSLTRIEKKVFSLIMSGKSNKEIALILCRSRRTIENHRSHIMKKLNAHNAVSLTLKSSLVKIHKLREDESVSENM